MSITPLIKKPGVMIISLDIPAGNGFFWKFCNSCHQNYEMELTEEQKEILVVTCARICVY